MEDPHELRQLLGRRFATAMPWVVHVASTGLHHGWPLAVALCGSWEADLVLAALRDAGHITRGKQELWFAREITAFGVGGSPGNYLHKMSYPCTYVWMPTKLLRETLWPRESPP